MDDRVHQQIESHSIAALRTLGAVEHYFWLSDQNSPKHFCMTLQVKGETTVECWRQAIEAVRLRHPLLRTTIARDALGVPSFYQSDASIPIKLIPAEPPHDWRLAVSDELMEPFEQGGPLARTVLFHSRSYTTLVFTAHHAVADGMSVAFILRDMLTVVGGGYLTDTSLPLAQETIASSWNLKPSSAEPPTVASPATMLDRTRGRPIVSSLQFSKDLSARIRTVARKHGTTVHGALLAAIILAGRRVSEVWRNGTVRAVSPVNLRSALGGKDECVVSIIFPIGGYSPHALTELWDLARSIRRDLAPSKTRGAIIDAFVNFQRIADSSPSVSDLAAIELQACACEMMLSNLGEAPIADTFGQVQVDALWGPSVFVGIEGEQMIGAATVCGQIHLLHTSFPPIAGLLEAAKGLLREAVA
ncbi:hypothetical protein QO004_003100 [Rhizobium mesoamericanum]|uniref:condensation domain-containing protein n=1 Tax=Rhizobium mesoamericanum TaxID=1079800 RepID=UPI002780630F|nr:condensation domain-containing protein [Rhizobium mesoamericanum]MDQ0561307.1 hypothetical protein [Rhizobium mesoamericanum]